MQRYLALAAPCQCMGVGPPLEACCLMDDAARRSPIAKRKHWQQSAPSDPGLLKQAKMNPNLVFVFVSDCFSDFLEFGHRD